MPLRLTLQQAQQIFIDKGAKLSAHHLYNWADYPEHRRDISNGITICRDHHIKFHSKQYYGKKNNTPDQYFEYASNFGA